MKYESSTYLVGNFANIETRFVENSKHSRVRRFYQVDNDFVVEVIHLRGTTWHDVTEKRSIVIQQKPAQPHCTLKQLKQKCFISHYTSNYYLCNETSKTVFTAVECIEFNSNTSSPFSSRNTYWPDRKQIEKLTTGWGNKQGRTGRKRKVRRKKVKVKVSVCLRVATRFLLSCILLVLVWGRVQWRVVVASRCSSWCRTVRNYHNNNMTSSLTWYFWNMTGRRTCCCWRLRSRRCQGRRWRCCALVAQACRASLRSLGWDDERSTRTSGRKSPSNRNNQQF